MNRKDHNNMNEANITNTNQHQIQEKSLIIVHNICQIGFLNYSHELSSQLEYWIKTVQSLLDQDYKNYKIVISGCMVKPESKIALINRFGNKICYNFIDKIYTHNITFNKTIEKMVNHYGEHDGYIWIDSGIHCVGHRNVLSEINIRLKTNRYGIINIETETDAGWDMILGPGVKSYNFQGKDFIQPLKTCIPLHFACFSNELKKVYDRLLPDVWRVGGNEFILPYMSATINKQTVIIKDLKVHHALGFNGGGSGFPAPANEYQQCDFLFGLTIQNVINKDEMRKTGMGFDDLDWGVHSEAHVIHNPELFTNEEFAIKHEELKNYILTYFYLPSNLLDYNSINCQFISN